MKQPSSFDTAEFLRLVDLGVFRGEHVQLVDGVIVRTSPASSFHHSTVWKLESWVVDLRDRQVDVRTRPVDGRYTRSQLFGPGESISVPRTTKRVRVADFLTAKRAS